MGSHRKGSLKLRAGVRPEPPSSSPGCLGPKNMSKREEKMLKQERSEKAGAEISLTSPIAREKEQPEKPIRSWRTLMEIRKRKVKRKSKHKLLMAIRNKHMKIDAIMLGSSPKQDVGVLPARKLGSGFKPFEVRNRERKMRKQNNEVARKAVDVDKGRFTTVEKWSHHNLGKLQREKEVDHDDQTEELQKMLGREIKEKARDKDRLFSRAADLSQSSAARSRSLHGLLHRISEDTGSSRNDYARWKMEDYSEETGKKELYPWFAELLRDPFPGTCSLVFDDPHLSDYLTGLREIQTTEIGDVDLKQLYPDSISTKSSLSTANARNDSKTKEKGRPEVSRMNDMKQTPVSELARATPPDPMNESHGREHKSPRKQSLAGEIRRRPSKPKNGKGKAESNTSELSVIVVSDSDDDNGNITTSISPSSRQSKAKKAEAALRVAGASAFVSNVVDRSKRFASLAGPEIKRALNWAYVGGSSDDIITYIPGCNISITRRSMCRLSQSKWLDCDVISAYAHLINERNIVRRKDISEVSLCDDENVNFVPSEDNRPVARVHCFDTFFYTLLAGDSGVYDYERVRRYTDPKQLRSGARPGVSIVDTDIIMVPVNIGQSHWVLCIIEMMKGRLYFADSLARSRRSMALTILGNVRQWLEDELLAKNNMTTYHGRKIRDFQLKPDFCVPQQRDSGSCGVFAIMYAEAIEWYGGVKYFDFSADSIRNMRDRMTLELLAGRLSLYGDSYTLRVAVA
eukprot:CAMPEP_0184693184 /NCGR_PEP_ID=MMETSP0313-20130426/1462_1 /TAXON_ID=2792 /ORGANISM="Porphyridium aerugineum, Strain SAG 1380-2" /LENGTH=742 /DNA_ID=CAMNT_0027151185 /DNA_START=164 /DNA_END=2388 /DNA_ORIENTATION=-